MTSQRNVTEMPAVQGADYLRRIRLATAQRELAALLSEIANAYPKDPFAMSLVSMIEARAARLLGRN